MAPYPAIGLKDARTRRLVAEELIHKKQSPVLAKKREKEAAKRTGGVIKTVEDLGESWIENVLRPANKQPFQDVTYVRRDLVPRIGHLASRHQHRTQARVDACPRCLVVTGWLLDANILSELRRPRPERKVLAFVASQSLELLYVSTVTLAEIRFGIERVPDPARRSELMDWLTHKVRPMFEQRALENRSWGYTRIQGALANLGHQVGRGTIANVLHEHGIDPAPERGKRTSWSTFLKAHWESIAATDLFTVEVLTLRGLVTHHVLFVLHLATRAVKIVGITTHPHEQWMMQMARNLTDVEEPFLRRTRFLIMDRDTEYSETFRAALARERIESIRLPPLAQSECIRGTICSLSKRGVRRPHGVLRPIISGARAKRLRGALSS